MTPARRLLRIALLALVLLYATWFAPDAQWVALAAFALPPLLLALALPRAPAPVALLAGLVALLWFSHGIMEAWARPAERTFALVEVALAVAVVLAARVPGLRKRYSRRPPRSS